MVVSHGFVQRGCYNRGPFPRQVAMSSKWKLEKRYESEGIKPKRCSYRPGRGNSTLVHLFGFVARYICGGFSFVRTTRLLESRHMFKTSCDDHDDYDNCIDNVNLYDGDDDVVLLLYLHSTRLYGMQQVTRHDKNKCWKMHRMRTAPRAIYSGRSRVPKTTCFKAGTASLPYRRDNSKQRQPAWCRCSV